MENDDLKIIESWTPKTKRLAVKRLLDNLFDDGEPARFSLNIHSWEDIKDLSNAMNKSSALYEFASWLRGIWKYGEEDTIKIEDLYERFWDFCTNECCDPFE